MLKLCRLYFVLAPWLIASRIAGAADPPAISFEITLSRAAAVQPVHGRLVLYLSTKLEGQPRLERVGGAGRFLLACQVDELKPGEPLSLHDLVGHPRGLAEIPPDRYLVQAVLHTRVDLPHSGNASDSLYSKPAVALLSKTAPSRVSLLLDQRIPAAEHGLTARAMEIVELRSESLSRFYGRDTMLRAAVIVPEEYASQTDRRFPAIYLIPGFGGDHMEGAMYADMLGTPKVPFVRVCLDPTCPLGHNVFADSDNNGPCGRALVEELIPYLEKRFRLISEPYARLLTGHSSGGWSSLWLQISYPDYFGGVWATSPDSVDFHDFCGIDLYDPAVNFFKDAQGKRRPIMRRGNKVMLYLDDFCGNEEVIGPGGQMNSFEAVFGPRGPDGRPARLWDRASGRIDPAVVDAWRRYDIVDKLRREWSTLGQKLGGKITVIMGDEDNFYLEGATKLLKKALDELGSDARVFIETRRDHRTIMFTEPFRRMLAEMGERFLAKHDTVGGGALPTSGPSSPSMKPAGG